MSRVAGTSWNVKSTSKSSMVAVSVKAIFFFMRDGSIMSLHVSEKRKERLDAKNRRSPVEKACARIIRFIPVGKKISV